MILLKTLFAHCLGDYVFQSDYLASNKGKDLYLLFVHCVLYTLGIFFVFGSDFSFLDYTTILTTHIVLDYVKASGITPKLFGDKPALAFDQYMHYIVLLFIIILHL